MSNSQFPDLNAPQHLQESAGGDSGFAAKALLDPARRESIASERPANNSSREVLLTMPPAAAIREYLSRVHQETEPTTKLISIVDPAGVWASQLINMISETGAQPVEKIHFRTRYGLRTVAGIEQTLAVRHHADSLRVAHTELRLGGAGGAEIQAALVEHSHMVAVIIGSTKSHEIDPLFNSLKAASARSSWRCPSLLFMLPPNSARIQLKIRALTWPNPLQVLLVEEPMTSPTAVWGVILAHWSLAQTQQARIRDLLGGARPSFKLSLRSPEPSASPRLVVTAELASVKLTVQKNDKAKAALPRLSAMEGVLAWAVVSDETAKILARDSSLGGELDLDQAAAACAKLMQDQRKSARELGLKSVDELTTTSGNRQIMMRPTSKRPGVFLMALLDKQRTNMTLARMKLLEIDRHLP